MRLAKEKFMHSTILRSLLVCVCAVAFSAPAAEPNTPAAPAITRAVLAATKLQTVVDAPVHFRAVSVTLPTGQSSRVSSSDGILYQLSGSTEVSVGNDSKTLSTGEALYLANGSTAKLKAGGSEPSTFLHFVLVPAADLDKPLEAAPAIGHELYRTEAPLPSLKPGRYDLTLSRITFPAQMASNAPHHRSGAALYYILSGTGANTIEGTPHNRAAGALIYEPFGLVHQWGNPGEVPLVFLVFNINPEGVTAVVPGAPGKAGNP
jgi:quercetin dioxygenase-like cupin family protein